MGRGNRGKPGKGRRQRSHARRRAYERLGIVLTKELEAQVIHQIQSGRARLAWKQSHRVSVWEVEIEGQLVRVPYDKDRKRIITIMPLTDESLE